MLREHNSLSPQTRSLPPWAVFATLHVELRQLAHSRPNQPTAMSYTFCGKHSQSNVDAYGVRTTSKPANHNHLIQG